MEPEGATLDKLQERIYELQDELKLKVNQSALEVQVLKESQAKQAKLIEKLQSNVKFYRTKCNDQESKIESIVASSGANPSNLPSAVRQLEMKLKEVRKQKEEQEQKHAEEIEALMDDSDHRNQQALALAANNANLRSELDRNQEKIERLEQNFQKLLVSRNNIEEEQKLDKEHWKHVVNVQIGKQSFEYITNLSAILEKVLTLKEELSDLKKEVTENSSMDDLSNVLYKIQCEYKLHLQLLRPNQAQLVNELESKQEEHNNMIAEITLLKNELSNKELKNNLIITQLQNEIAVSQNTIAERDQIVSAASLELEEVKESCAKMKAEIVELSNQIKILHAEKEADKGKIFNMQHTFNSIVALFNNTGCQDVCLPPDENSFISSTTIENSNMKITTCAIGSKEHLSEEQEPVTPMIGKISKDPPKFFGTTGDVKRITKWALSVVKSGVTAQNKMIQNQNMRLSDLQEKLRKLNYQNDQSLDEIKTHTTTINILKRDLENCRTRGKKLEESQTSLLDKLDTSNSKMMEAERKASQYETQLKDLEEQKVKLLQNHLESEAKLAHLEGDISSYKATQEELQIEITRKWHANQALKTQLQSSHAEIEILQEKLAELKMEELNTERELSESRIQIKYLTTENDELQQELINVKESEDLLLNTVMDLQKTNASVESEKRSLQKSLDEISEREAQLDEANTKLGHQKMSQEDEIDRLHFTNNQLTEQIAELDDNIQSLETICLKLRKDKHGLREQTAALTDAFGKIKQTLAEVQQQRGRLNQTIARVAQEKGLLVHEKVKQAARIAELEKDLQVSKSSALSLHDEKEKLQSHSHELNVKIAEIVANLESLEKNVLSLQTEKQNILKHNSAMLLDKDRVINEMQEKYTEEMAKQVVASKTLESNLQSSLHSLKVANKMKMAELIDKHNLEMIRLEENSKEVANQLKQQLDVAIKEGKEQIAKITKEKDTMALNFEKENSDLLNKVLHLKKINKQQSLELNEEKQQSVLTADELKYQLTLAAKMSDNLGSELNSTEEEMVSLQATIDQIKHEAQTQIDALQEKLLDSARKYAKLETENHEAKQTILHYEETINNLRKYSENIEGGHEALIKERDTLYLEKQSFQRDICNVQYALEKEKETTTHLKEALSKSESAKCAAIDECKQISKAYRTNENSLTKLSMEHVSLQSAYTSTEKEMTQLQLQVESVKLENTKIEQEKRQTKEELDKICNQLIIATESYSTKEKELMKAHELLSTLYQELDKLRSEIIKLENESHSQNISATSDIESLKQLLENMTRQRDEILHNTSITETSLWHEIEQNKKVQSEIVTLRKTNESLTNALEKSKHFHQKVSVSYRQLIAILESTLNISICTGTATESECCNISNECITLPKSGIQLVEETVLSIQSSLAKSIKESSELRNQADCLVKEKEYYLARSNEMETRIDQLQHTNAKMETVVTQLTAKNQELEINKSSLQKDNAILESANTTLEKQVELAHENLKLAQRSCKASDDRYEKASKSLVQNDNESKKLEQELEQMMTHKKLLEEQLADSINQMAMLSDASLKEKSQYTQQREHLHDLVDVLSRENNSLKMSLQEKDNSLKASKSVEICLQNEVSDTLRDRANLKDQLNDIQRKLSDAENTLLHAHDDKEKMKDKIKNLLELKNVSEENYISLQKQMVIMTSKVNKIEEEKSKLCSQLESCKIQLEESEAKLQEFATKNVQQQPYHMFDEDMHKTEVTKLKTELQDSKQKAWELQFQLEKILEQGDAQQHTVDNPKLIARIKELEQALEDCKQNCSMQVATLQETKESKVESLTNNFKRQQAQWDGCKADYKKMIQELEKKVKLLEDKRTYMP